MNVFGSVLAELCQKEWEDRDDDDIIIIERILLLIRNVLHIRSDPTREKVCNMDCSLIRTCAMIFLMRVPTVTITCIPLSVHREQMMMPVYMIKLYCKYCILYIVLYI